MRKDENIFGWNKNLLTLAEHRRKSLTMISYALEGDNTWYKECSLMYSRARIRSSHVPGVIIESDNSGIIDHF